MEIGLLDILLLIIPFFVINIVLVLFTTSHFPIKAKIPLIMTSYSILITTIVFLIVIIFHFHFESSVTLHIHELHSPTIISVLSLNLDLLGFTILLFVVSVIISGLILSQLAFYMLNRHYISLAILNTSLDIIIEDFNIKTKELIAENKIEFIVIDDEFPYLFTFSYFKLFQKKSVILLASIIFDLLNEQEIEIGILHEIGHLNHMDTIFNPVFNAMSKIMFFDPFLKRIKEKYQEKIEIRADDFVINHHDEHKLLIPILLKINRFILEQDSVKGNQYAKIAGLSSKSLLENRLQNIKKKNYLN